MQNAAGQRESVPALVVRNAEQAAAALRVADGRRVLLLSAPGAAGFLGPLAWRALVARAESLVPGAPFDDALCCGDAPGHALAALRAGCRLLVLHGACPAFAQVEAAAEVAGARLLPGRPPAFDAMDLDLRKPGARVKLAQWLAASPHDSAAIQR
ncbi:hypothetical protein [Falsiroseomonas sp. HW251]|uniref:hypothetical protein n=1 Tax=Falsiroseomonas sp. HW251 TaxID=3390998 RepID=UPI003D31065C